MNQESKQNKFHVQKPYKTGESTLLLVGKSEENIDQSRIYLAVLTKVKTTIAVISKI